MKNFVYGKHFVYEKKKYCIIGSDSSRNEIECQTVPFDGNYYKDKARKLPLLAVCR